MRFELLKAIIRILGFFLTFYSLKTVSLRNFFRILLKTSLDMFTIFAALFIENRENWNVLN